MGNATERERRGEKRRRGMEDPKKPVGTEMGKVQGFSATKGYGFIMCNSLEKAVFVHQKDIYASESNRGYRSLKIGEEVAFDLIQDPSGKQRAVNVTSPDGG